MLAGQVKSRPRTIFHAYAQENTATGSKYSTRTINPLGLSLPSIGDSSSVYSPQNLTNKYWEGAIEDEEEKIENSFDSNSLSPASSVQTLSEVLLVELSQKSTSFDRTEYLVFSELSSSQPSTGTRRRFPFPRSCLTPSSSPSTTAWTAYRIDRVIPDSQPSFLSSELSYSPAEHILDPSGIGVLRHGRFNRGTAS